jgi:hypothetical protein
MTNIGHTLADAWNKALLECPDPYVDSRILNPLFGLPCETYREHLDRPRRNYLGHIIPRIALVRRWMLRDPHRAASRLP